MNTPAHLVIGAAAFARPASRRMMGGALVGAMLPDLSLYVMVGVAIGVLGISPYHVFNVLYFSDAWQTVFAIDNSFILWGALLVLAMRRKVDWAIALCGSALLHIALDFPLHHDDGRPHFWPLSDWVFESPVSYWDRNHGAQWIAPIEAALVSVCAITLWLRKPGIGFSVFVLAMLAVEMWIVRQWLFFFVDG